MTERDPGEGFFDYLDDDGWAAPGNDALPAVLLRGQRLRTRRRTILATSTVVGITAAVFGGLGVSHALNASGPDSTVVPPATNGPSVSATPTGTGTGHHRGHGGSGGNQILAPGASVTPGTHPTDVASTPPPEPTPTDSCGAAIGGHSAGNRPLSDTTLPPIAPTPSASPTCEPSPTPSGTPSESTSPEPTDSAEPTSPPPSG